MNIDTLTTRSINILETIELLLKKDRVISELKEVLSINKGLLNDFIRLSFKYEILPNKEQFLSSYVELINFNENLIADLVKKV